MTDVSQAPAEVTPDTEISDNSADESGPIDPQDNEPPKEEPKPDPLRSVKHKIKSNGKEKELDYDELIKKAELADGAYYKFDETAKKEKEWQQKLSKLKEVTPENLDALLEYVPFEKLLDISSHIEKMKLEFQGYSKEQIDDYLERLDGQQAKKKLQEIEAEREEGVRRQRQAEAFQVIEKEIGDVLEEAKGLGYPIADLPGVGVEIIDEMLHVLQVYEEAQAKGEIYSGKIPTAKEIFEQIKTRYDSRLDTYLKKFSPEKLASVLTPEQSQALRQADLNKLYGNNPRPDFVPEFDQGQSTPSMPSKKMSVKQAFSQLDEKYGARR